MKLNVRNEVGEPPGGRLVGLFCPVRRSLHPAGKDGPYRLLSWETCCLLRSLMKRMKVRLKREGAGLRETSWTNVVMIKEVMREVRSENRLWEDVSWDAHLTSSLFLLTLFPSLITEKNGFPLDGIAQQEKSHCQLPWEPKKRGSRLPSTPVQPLVVPCHPHSSLLHSHRSPSASLPDLKPHTFISFLHVLVFTLQVPSMASERKHLFVKETYISTQQTKKLKQLYSTVSSQLPTSFPGPKIIN